MKTGLELSQVVYYLDQDVTGRTVLKSGDVVGLRLVGGRVLVDISQPGLSWSIIRERDLVWESPAGVMAALEKGVKVIK